MKTGKITAKLRDAVPVCLMVEGKKVKRYKNIELPDMLKEVESSQNICNQETFCLLERRRKVGLDNFMLQMYNKEKTMLRL